MCQLRQPKGLKQRWRRGIPQEKASTIGIVLASVAPGYRTDSDLFFTVTAPFAAAFTTAFTAAFAAALSDALTLAFACRAAIEAIRIFGTSAFTFS